MYYIFILCTLLIFPLQTIEQLVKFQQAAQLIADATKERQAIGRLNYSTHNFVSLNLERFSSGSSINSEEAFKWINTITQQKEALKQALRELITTYQKLSQESIFSFCLCHGIPMRFEAIIQIIEYIQKHYKPEDHIVYTSLGAGNLLQEVLTLHMLQACGYTKCTFNAIDILYFDPTSLSNEQIAKLEHMHDTLKKRYPNLVPETLQELIFNTQIRIAYIKKLFPQYEINMYQYADEYTSRFKITKEKQNEYINILTMIDPDVIGIELSGPIGALHKPTEADILSNLRAILNSLFGHSYPLHQNVLLFSEHQPSSIDSYQQAYQTFVYLPSSNILPPCLLSKQETLNSTEDKIFQRLQKGISIGDLVSAFNIQNNIYINNSYLSFFDIAADMMAKQGILVYTQAHGAFDKGQIVYLTSDIQDFSAKLIEAYHKSMDKLKEKIGFMRCAK